MVRSGPECFNDYVPAQRVVTVTVRSGQVSGDRDSTFRPIVWLQ